MNNIRIITFCKYGGACLLGYIFNEMKHLEAKKLTRKKLELDPRIHYKEWDNYH